MYFPWNSEFDESVEINAIELPGQHSRFREQPFEDASALIENLLQSVTEKLDKPFAFFGHSLGALLSHELTCVLAERGLPQPKTLFVSSFRAPHTPKRLPDIGHLADDAFVQAIQSRYGGIPEAVLQEKDLLDLMLPGLRSGFKMFEDFRFQNQPPLAASICAFGGRQDKVVAETELDAWRERTLAEFELFMFEGGHFYLTEGRLPDLSAVIRQKLSAEQRKKAA